MGTRGRRPHPDILTPREWEVLGLLQERLTNEQIAERLGITLDGAKYHVSQILSKLGVATREEAAVWEPEERWWWQRLIALPVAATVAAASAVIAVVVGIGLLALNGGTAEQETEAQQILAWEPPDLPEPLQPPRLTRDQALLRGAGGDGRIALVDARASQMGAILRNGAGPLPSGIELAGHRSTNTAWMVTTLGEFSQPDRGPPAIDDERTYTPTKACREITTVFPDDRNQPDPANPPTSSYSVSNPLPAEKCNRPKELDRDLAVVYGARAIADRFAAFSGSPVVETFLPREVPSERTTLGEATDIAEQEHMEVDERGSADDDTPVWLLRFRGPFSYSPDISRGPSYTAICNEIAVVIHAESGETLLTGEKQRQDC
jgi:DNA-binding CsgD family transcriptional regulator